MTNGKRIGRPPMDPDKRFDSHVNFDGPIPSGLSTPCWLWTASAQANGYAQFTTGSRRNAVRTTVHRYNYARHIGPIPSGYQVDHLCKVPLCVNPGHLEAVPARVNNERSDSPTAKNARMTICKYGLHELAGENLDPWYLARGERRCLPCKRERQREKRREQRTVN